MNGIREFARRAGAEVTYVPVVRPELRLDQASMAAALAAADPDVIASGNPGCLIQLRAGARRWGLRARVVHPIELLAESYGEL